MKRAAWGWFLLSLACVLPAAVAGCRRGGEDEGGGGPFPALSPPKSGEPDENGLVTKIRPRVARVGDQDPLLVVLHFDGKAGPLPMSDPTSVSWPRTFDALT